MTENLDAMRAVEYVPLDDRESFKTALGATLVKNHGHHRVFDTVFEVYFSIFSPGVDEDGEGSDLDPDAQADFEQLRAAMDGGGAMGQLSNEELAQMLLDALMRMDTEQTARARAARRSRASRAWSRADRSAARTTSTARCGSSTPTVSSPR